LSRNNHRTRVFPYLPPREVVSFLVSTFFQFAQANFFYIHPEIFNRKLLAFYEGSQEFGGQGLHDTRKSAEFICLLFMVLAIGSQFADLESDSQEQPPVNVLLDPSAVDISKLEPPKLSPNPGWRFYEVAQSLLSDVVASSSMTSVQACVLQGTFLLSTNARDVSYNVLGLALRMAVNMGMHRSVSTESLHPHVRELRNRLWWSVYIAERLFSVEMGRPLAIDDSEIDVPFPVDIPELNTNGRGNFDSQIAMAKLCQIMGKIVKEVYSNSSSALAKRGKEIHARSFQQLKIELDMWKSALPEALKLSSTCSRAVAHIHLTYEQAIILLTRTCLNHAVAESNASPLSVASRKFIHRNAQDCLSAARSCIQIMSALGERSLLSRFSFHDFLYCSAALYVLLLGAKLERPVTPVKTTILQGIVVLYELAKGSEAAALSLNLISRGFQAFIKTQTSVSYSNTNFIDEDGRKRGRRAWQNWACQTVPISVSTLNDNWPTILFTDILQGVLGGLVDGGQVSNGLRENRPLGTSSNAPTYENSDAGPSPFPDTNSERTDVQTFWLPDLDCNFDLLGRDLAGAPSLESFNYHDFTPFNID
jgi:hypothetical protein